MKFFGVVVVATICAIFGPQVSSFSVGSKYCQKCFFSVPTLQRIRAFGERMPMMTVADNEAQTDDVEPSIDLEEDEVLDVLDTEIVATTEEVNEEPKVVELDPYEVAVKALEAQLKIDIMAIESNLKSERNSLSKTKDKASESGKNGYFIVQAKVAEFQKNRDAEQKSRVTRNKREFVMKMLPVVDAFREAPLISPSTTDRESSMHKSFGSLLESILVVFEKYGFKEYDAEIGATLVPARHQVSEVIEGEVDGVVASQSKRGLIDKDGEVVRRAIVVATKAPVADKEAEVTEAEVDLKAED